MFFFYFATICLILGVNYAAKFHAASGILMQYEDVPEEIVINFYPNHCLQLNGFRIANNVAGNREIFHVCYEKL